MCDLITNSYRQKGYVTSRAYLPPQKIEQQSLEIKVIEGVTGDLEIKGNRYFKGRLFERRITLKKGKVFNYNLLRKNLIKINKHPDRTARAVLMPGKEVGATDIVLEVKDQLPFHIDLHWDNFGSRYTEKNHYRTTLIHNNFLGRDDILTLQYQIGEADTYRLTGLRYILSLLQNLHLGFFILRTKSDLGREYKDLDVRGKTKSYSLYLTQFLIEEDTVFSLNLGFEYKDIFNFQLGNEISRDRLRILKLGLDLDTLDLFGRTILTFELDLGIPKIMAGLKKRDARASRNGSGGKFSKSTINILRLQKMPFNSQLLWKNQIQISPYILPAAEQFQIGGISNVRGYPPGEYTGDKGYATTIEWLFPFYFIPQRINFFIKNKTL